MNATDPFYHGTRADLAPGDLLAPGLASNDADRTLSWITFSSALDAAIHTSFRHPRERGDPVAVEALEGADWVPAFAGMTKEGYATRPSPTARANRCAWSATSSAGSRIRPSGSPR